MSAVAPEITAAELSEYEMVMLVDKSGSMGTIDVQGGPTRWKIAQEHVTAAANFFISVDENGIDVILFSGEVKVFRNVKTAQDVANIFANTGPKGGTDLASAIDAAQAIRAEKPGKNYIFFVITDGEPESESAAAESIAKAVRTMKKDKELAIQFLQIGKDPDATRFLKRLDDDIMRTMKLPFDAVDTMTAAESENLSFEAMMWRAAND